MLLRVMVFGLLLARAFAGPPAPSHSFDFPQILPLVEPATEWAFNEGWLTRRIGPRSFYMAGQGPYQWLTKEGLATLHQVGFDKQFIPGHINFSYIKYFLPEERQKLPEDAPMRKMVEGFLKNGWPFQTVFYHRFKGNPPPSDRLRRIFGDQWMGDGQPETVYRLEPVFHYLKTGKRWVGSSMGHWKPEVAIEFFKNDLVPRLEKEFPFIHDLKHPWTRPELRRLSDIYGEEFYRPIGRTLVWGMYVGAYHMASLPTTISVGEKGADAFSAARLRGMNRQFGGNKFLVVWRGHEPTEMYGYFNRAWFSTRGDEWGLPLPHLWYYIYRPCLIGANYYVNEGFPGSGIRDIEGDGQLELSTTGLILKNMLDFVERHPDRGVPYTPIALMLDADRAFPYHGTTYAGYNLPNDNADMFNAGMLDLVFPEHRHARFVGGYSRTAPYGELFDILQPNLKGKSISPEALENYRVLFALGGMKFEGDFARKVVDHVRRGGTLILNARDTSPAFPPKFLGLELSGKKVPGGPIRCNLDHAEFEEKPYFLLIAKLSSAEAIFSDSSGKPVITRNHFGKGQVIVLLPDYCVEKEAYRFAHPRGLHYLKKDLLKGVGHFLEHLSTGVSPVEVRMKEEDRPDLSWIVSKKKDGWVVTMFDYSCARESIVSKWGGTAKMHATYPLKEIPFQIIFRAPAADVIEWYKDRDVNWIKENGKTVISETMHGGEIRVYEIQPRPIKLEQRSRFVNYALRRPVKASSSLKGYPPENAVDGDLSRFNGWWSDTDPRRHYRFEMPQWLEVDLGQVRTIDHAFVLFHWWKQENLQTRLRVYKYIVEASADGKEWVKVMDESRNEDNARKEGTERWFDPVKARYVRLTMLRNSAFSGARVVELAVMGEEKETYQPRRISIVPDWEVQYPPALRNVDPKRVTWLLNLKPTAARVGWLPAGKTWKGLSGTIRLLTDRSGGGRDYKHAIYGEAPSEFVYRLDGRFKTFAAAAGIGTTRPNASVEFVVYVDGKQKYKSSVYRIGQPVLPVVVDVQGAEELKLVVTDAGDGLRDDYSWWGEARLIR